jgi:hypothetical protein
LLKTLQIESNKYHGDFAMKTESDANVIPDASDKKPYAMLGAGKLTATLWKSGDERSGWHYRFNIFRMSKTSGRVSQNFKPHDLPDLAKLARLLAFTISDDGCLCQELCDALFCLAACLENVPSSNRGSDILMTTPQLPLGDSSEVHD